MKITKLMLCFVAASTMLFAACGDEKEEIVVGDNELMYDGTLYNMSGSAIYSTTPQGLFVEFQFEGEGNAFHLAGIMGEGSVNQSYDLAVHADGVHYNFDFFSDTEGVPSFSFDNYYDGFTGGMEGVDDIVGSIFSEGTCVNTLDNDVYTMHVKGTLKNGKKIEFKINVPATEMSPF